MYLIRLCLPITIFLTLLIFECFFLFFTGVPQYDYDFVDMSSRSKERKRPQKLARRKMRTLKARRHPISQAVPKQSFKSMDSSTKPLPLPHMTKAESKIDLWTLPKDIVPNPNVQDLKH